MDMESDICHKAIDLNLNMLRANQDLCIHFTGGEPLLNESLIRNCLLNFKDIKNINYRITTNGTLLNKDWFDLLSKYNFFVSISVDGIESAHNRHRIGSKNWYNVIIANIGELKRHSIPFEVCISVHPDCVDMLVNGVEFLISIGVTRLSIAPVYSKVIEWPSESVNNLCNSLMTISKIASQKNIEVIPITSNCDHIGGKYTSIWGCGAGCNTLAVSPNGEIFGCSALAPYVSCFPLIKQGDVNSGLCTVQNQGLCSALQKDENSRTFCKLCDVMDDCAGGCPAINFAMTGDIYSAPDVYCSLIRATRVAWQARYGNKDIELKVSPK